MHERGDQADLVPLQAADEVPAGEPSPSTRRLPWRRAPGRSSPRRRPGRQRPPPPPWRLRWPLVTATTTTRSGSPPASLIRSRTALEAFVDRRVTTPPARPTVAKRSDSARARWLYQRRSQAVQPDVSCSSPTPASANAAATAAGRSSAGVPQVVVPAHRRPVASGDVIELWPVELVAADADARSEVGGAGVITEIVHGRHGALDHAAQRGRASPRARRRRTPGPGARSGRSQPCARPRCSRGSRSRAASASTPACSPGVVTTTTRSPWTWCSHVQSGWRAERSPARSPSARDVQAKRGRSGSYLRNDGTSKSSSPSMSRSSSRVVTEHAGRVHGARRARARPSCRPSGRSRRR